MKTILTTLTALFLFTSMSFSQGITFRIETSQIFSPTNQNLNRSNYNVDPLNVSVYGTTASSLAAIQSAASTFLSNNSEEALSTFFNSSAFSSGFNQISVSPGTGPFASLDWNGTVSNLTPGDTPVLVVTSQAIKGLGANDFFGVVATDLTVGALGTDVVGFTTGTGNWNQQLIGDLGSLTLVSVVPEPSAYAAIAGLLALGWVATRRRK